MTSLRQPRRDVPLNESPGGTEIENDITNDLEITEIASNGGAYITVPGILKKSEEKSSPRGGNIIFDLTTPQLY